MGGKLDDIRETSSNAIQIIRDLKNPETQKSLDGIKEITATVKGIIESFKEPSMVKNIENFRMTVESAERISSKFDSLRSDAGNSGVMEELSSAIKACRFAAETISKEGGAKDLIAALKELISEISSTVAETKKILDSMGNFGENSEIASIRDNVREIRKYASSVKKDIGED